MSEGKLAMKPAASRRLDARTWIVAGLQRLSMEGIDGVRIELLAKQLGVTKGSFYWHFDGRDALHLAMLDYWRSRATIILIERMDQSTASPMDRLRQLVDLVAQPKSRWGDDVELALRLWSKRDPRPRKTLEEVDRLRVSYIAGLLTDTGVSAATARARALVIYSFMRVARSLSPVCDDASFALAKELLVAPG